MTRQSFISANQWFSASYSRLWEVEIVEGIPVFFDPLDGLGALQIYSLIFGEIPDEKVLKVFPFLSGINLQEKMKLFLSAQGIFRSTEDIPLHEVEGHTMVAQEYQIESTFYMAVMKQKQKYFILAVYNCENYPSQSEAAEVGAIISSIKFLN